MWPGIPGHMSPFSLQPWAHTRFDPGCAGRGDLRWPIWSMGDLGPGLQTPARVGMTSGRFSAHIPRFRLRSKLYSNIPHYPVLFLYRLIHSKSILSVYSSPGRTSPPKYWAHVRWLTSSTPQIHQSLSAVGDADIILLTARLVTGSDQVKWSPQLWPWPGRTRAAHSRSHTTRGRYHSSF